MSPSSIVEKGWRFALITTVLLVVATGAAVGVIAWGGQDLTPPLVLADRPPPILARALPHGKIRVRLPVADVPRSDVPVDAVISKSAYYVAGELIALGREVEAIERLELGLLDVDPSREVVERTEGTLRIAIDVRSDSALLTSHLVEAMTEAGRGDLDVLVRRRDGSYGYLSMHLSDYGAEEAGWVYLQHWESSHAHVAGRSGGLSGSTEEMVERAEEWLGASPVPAVFVLDSTGKLGDLFEVVVALRRGPRVPVFLDNSEWNGDFVWTPDPLEGLNSVEEEEANARPEPR